MSAPPSSLRERLATLAQSLANQAPWPLRAVVVVMDQAGEWVGVGMTTTPDDARTVLVAALTGPDKQEHSAGDFGAPAQANAAALESALVRAVLTMRERSDHYNASGMPWRAKARDMAGYLAAQTRAEDALIAFRKAARGE